jgi:hypothetical protein
METGNFMETGKTRMHYLDDYVSGAIASTKLVEETLNREQLRNIWQALTDRPNLGDADLDYEAFESTFLEALAPSEKTILEFKPGGWTVKISEGVLRSTVSAALLSGVLYATGFTGLPLLVLPTVLPFLVDIEKIRLSKGEKEILFQLVLREEARAKSARELYDVLPQNIRDEISFLDFQEFLEKCRRAGFADEVDYGKYSLRAGKQAIFRVTFL